MIWVPEKKKKQRQKKMGDEQGVFLKEDCYQISRLSDAPEIREYMWNLVTELTDLELAGRGTAVRPRR